MHPAQNPPLSIARSDYEQIYGYLYKSLMDCFDFGIAKKGLVATVNAIFTSSICL